MKNWSDDDRNALLSAEPKVQAVPPINPDSGASEMSTDPVPQPAARSTANRNARMGRD